LEPLARWADVQPFLHARPNHPRQKIRAFSADSGEELWAAERPLHGTAPRTTYEVAGRQFVVVAATGGGKLGGRTADAWVAFALPKPK